jgi:hypothetical protein
VFLASSGTVLKQARIDMPQAGTFEADWAAQVTIVDLARLREFAGDRAVVTSIASREWAKVSF